MEREPVSRFVTMREAVRRSLTGGLVRHADFRRLWIAETVSIFGSLVTRTALPFAAIIELDATPFQLALIGVAELVPAFLVGLVAGAWVDRLPRRPIMIVADLGRALIVLAIPAAAVADALRIELLYATAVLVSVLTVFFDVAYQAYLPTLVRREELLEGNSKLTASASVAEFAAFGSGGWLVQWLTAPFAMLVDAVTFLWSAYFVWRIETPEPPPAPAHERQRLAREIVEGVRYVAGNPTLRALTASSAMLNLTSRIFGTVFLLYVNRELGFSPGELGLIFAIGGASSLIGAASAGRVTRRLGIGPTMIVMLLIVGIGQAFIPLAADATLIAVGFLIAQQAITDPAWTIYDISHVSLRQEITPDRWQGRMNASMRVVDFGAMLLGALLGGWLGGAIGLRATLLVAVAGAFFAATPLLASSVRRLRSTTTNEPEASPITETL